MTRPSWHAILTTVVIFSIIPQSEIGQAYQNYKPGEQNSSFLYGLTTEASPTLLAQAEDVNKADETQTDEQEAVDRVLYLLWRSSLILSLSALILLTIIILYGLFNKRDGTIILPFKNLLKEADLADQSTESKSNYKERSKLGEAVVDFLIVELHNIRQKYEELEVRDQSIVSDSRKLQAPLGESCVDASSLRKQILVGSPTLPHLRIGDSNIIGNIGNIGEVITSGPIATRISLDSLMLLFKRIWPFNHKNRIIAGSIQKYDSGLRIIARMEQGKFTRAWQVKSEDKNADLSKLVQELALLIAKDLSKQQLSQEAFKDLLNLLDSYRKLINHDSDLGVEDLCQDCIDFVDRAPTFEGVFGLLYNVGIATLEKHEYEMAEKIFRQAISLEPYIINKVFDTKVAYRDINWGKDFWINSFKEYCDRTSWQHYFAYSFRSLTRRYSPNIETRNEYQRMCRWANGLSYTLLALGQALEKFDSNKNSSPDRFVRLSQAKEAYARADKRDREDVSPLTHLSSLVIENVHVFENHNKLREGIIEEAKKELDRALQKPRYKCLAYNRLGNLFHDQGDYKRAIKFYKRAITDRPDFIVAYRNLGIAQGEIMEFDEAIKSFTEGMAFLPDDAIFQTHFCQNKWHAWLHNGIGWTYLIKYLYTSLSDKSNSSVNMLTLAKYNFHEAITISSDQMFASFFNLGNTYALDGQIDEAEVCWKRGLDILGKQDKDSVLGRLLDLIYTSSDSQNEYNILLGKLKKFTLAQGPPIRMTNAVLQDLLVVKKCQEEKGYFHLDEMIYFLEDYLPTLYIAVSYIWKQEPRKTVAIFQRKLPELYLEYNGLPYSFFSSYLWLLIYSGLIKIFGQGIDYDPIDYQVFTSYRQPKLTLKSAISVFNEEAKEMKIQELQIDELNSYSLEQLGKFIQEVIIRFNEIIKKEDSPRELFRQILNDMHRKHEILHQGVGKFHGNIYENKLSIIFQPIEDYYQNLEGKILHDEKIKKSKIYSYFFDFKN